MGNRGNERAEAGRSFDFQAKELRVCLGGGRELHKDLGRWVCNVIFPTVPEPAAGEGTGLSPA